MPSSKAAVKFQLFKIHIQCIALENSVKINFDNLMINFLSFTWLFWIGFQSRFIYIKSIRLWDSNPRPCALRTERLYELSGLDVDEMFLVERLNTGSSDREAYKSSPGQPR